MREAPDRIIGRQARLIDALRRQGRRLVTMSRMLREENAKLHTKLQLEKNKVKHLANILGSQ